MDSFNVSVSTITSEQLNALKQEANENIGKNLVLVIGATSTDMLYMLIIGEIQCKKQRVKQLLVNMIPVCLSTG